MSYQVTETEDFLEACSTGFEGLLCTLGSLLLSIGGLGIFGAGGWWCLGYPSQVLHAYRVSLTLVYKKFPYLPLYFKSIDNLKAKTVTSWNCAGGR